MPEFTHDWFSQANPNFWSIADTLGKVPDILEIGCFEGRATCWMLEHLLTDDGTITCIDTFGGGIEHNEMAVRVNMQDVKERFDRNTSEVMKRQQVLRLCTRESHVELAEMVGRGNWKFDFIYIDGSHQAKDVITDACLAFRLLKTGGIMLFDDYLWGGNEDIVKVPKMAVDAFTTMFCWDIHTQMLGYQVAVRKHNGKGEYV